MLKLSWSVKRESGRPLLPADIERYELSATYNGNALVVQQPGPADLSFDYAATEPGVYAFKLVCVPKRGGKSDAVTASVELFDDTKVVVLDFTIEVIGP